MTRRAGALATLAVACATAGAFAADRERAPEETLERGRPEASLPVGDTPTLPGQVVEGLQHLRLHPGVDGLDVSETAHRPPAPGKE